MSKIRPESGQNPAMLLFDLFMARDLRHSTARTLDPARIRPDSDKIIFILSDTGRWDGEQFES